MKTSEKTCRDCNETLPISEYYVHKCMADGHLNKCKSCVKQRVKRHRARNIDRVRSYDRRRARSGKRKKHLASQSKRFRKQNPEKYRAHSAVNAAVRTGRLIPSPHCETCGLVSDRLQGHHEDYSKPLDVVWLCAPCHAARHMELRAEAQ